MMMRIFNIFTIKNQKATVEEQNSTTYNKIKALHNTGINFKYIINKSKVIFLSYLNID